MSRRPGPFWAGSAELLDALLALIGELRHEMQAIMSLLDARSEGSTKRSEFRIAFREHIEQTLTLNSSGLASD